MNLTQQLANALADVSDADAKTKFIHPVNKCWPGLAVIGNWRKNAITMPLWAIESLIGTPKLDAQPPHDTATAPVEAPVNSMSSGAGVSSPVPSVDPGFSEINPAWSQLPEWADANLLIGVPMLDHMHPKTEFALFYTLTRHHKKISYFPCVGNPIGRARNQLATYFLNNTKADWLLMLDGDMLPYFGNPLVWAQWGGLPEHPMADMDFVARLVSHGKPLVGGHYVGRSKTGTCQFAEAYENSSVNRKYHAGITDELLPTKWVAAGLLLIHRAVFEAIIANQPELKPRYDGDVYRFFAMEDDEGEDMLFCQRARQAGIQPHVDIGCPAGHIGEYIFWPHNTTPTAPRVGQPMDAKDKTGIAAQIVSQTPKPLPPATLRPQPMPIVRADPAATNPALRPHKVRPGAVKAFMRAQAIRDQGTMNVSPKLPPGFLPPQVGAPKQPNFSEASVPAFA